MNNTICLDENYSTTRLLTQEVPQIANKITDKFETILFLPENEERKGEGGLRTKGYFKKSYADKPLVSIITVVYNGEKHLEETIKSIISQTYDNVEYIIIDGGSTDGTVDIVKKYEDRIDYWVSEKDGGIYDAMNKGLILSLGDMIGIVNSDDIIYKETLKVATLSKRFDYVYGSVHLMSQTGIILGEMLPMPKEDINIKKYIDIPFPHPSLFITREVYKEIGTFNTKFKLSADYDFILRFLERDYKGLDLCIPTGKFRSGGSSGGISTFLDTKDVLISHNVSKILVYKNMLVSISKVMLLKYFTKLSLRFREKFRQKSRHKIYAKK